MTRIWLLPHSIKPDMNKEHQQWGKSTICQVPSWVADIIAIFQKCHCRQVGGNANSLIQHDFHSAVTCWPTLCICCSTLVNKQGAGGVITLSKCSRFILTLNISRFFFSSLLTMSFSAFAQYMHRMDIYILRYPSHFSLLTISHSVHHGRHPNNITSSFTTTVSYDQFITVKEQCFCTG